MFDLNERASGVLLHPTSLPGPHGNGDLGGEARRFADQLARAGQRWWQMLPVGPPGIGNSPYSARSAFAGSPLLIDLDALAGRGMLRELPAARFPRGRVDYPAAESFRAGILERAFESFARRRRPAAFDAFCDRAAAWLPDFALFSAIKDAAGGAAWSEWEPGLRLREPASLRRARGELRDRIELHRFQQWIFDEQWRGLKRHCNGLGVGLIGDLPIFVALDSADVWAHRELFELDESGAPNVIAGVPPDFFSRTGQRWGNPHYRWAVLRRQGYRWWMDRFQAELSRFDAVRLDHFIGFWRTWHVPARAPTAERGRWVPGPRDDLFRKLLRKRGTLPLIVEDLGLVTPEVRALRDRLRLPGMKLLQFAFGSDLQAHEFRPHNYPRRAAAYTGTHDNDTIVGWFFDRGGKGSQRTAAQAETERRIALAYLGADDASEIHWKMIRLLFESVADLAVVPMQDLLGLGSEARMNLPGTVEGNWEWRLADGAFTPRVSDRLAEITELYERRPAKEARA